jgi:hypothetical protein
MSELTKIIDTRKSALLAAAFSKHPDARPCPTSTDGDFQFTYYGGDLLLWYDTPDHSTHLIRDSYLIEQLSRQAQ